jgi:hypothetical protein
VIAGLYAFTAFGTYCYVHIFLLPKIHASTNDLARFEPRILADLKLLTTDPIYKDLPREKNAERFLSGFISWAGSHVEVLKDLNHDRLITLMKAHERALQNDEEWAALLADDQLKDLDLKWVDQLAAYDHINFGTHPVYHDLLARVEHAHGYERMQIAAALPLPDMNELRFAALARVAQLETEDRIDEAIPLYRHVGYLISTTDSMVGLYNSVIMLQNEKSLAERTDFKWPVVDSRRISAMKRTSWAWSGIERIKSRQGSLGAFEPYFKRSANACAGVLEVLNLESMLQDYLSPTTFLESDFRDRLAKQNSFAKQLYTVCDHENLNVFLTPIAEADSPLMLSRRKVNPARIPFLRRIIGLTLLTEAIPNDFRLYEEDPRQPASSD